MLIKQRKRRCELYAENKAKERSTALQEEEITRSRGKAEEDGRTVEGQGDRINE